MRKLILTSFLLQISIVSYCQFFEQGLNFKNNLGSQLRDNKKFALNSIIEINDILHADGSVFDMSARFRAFSDSICFLRNTEFGINFKGVFNRSCEAIVYDDFVYPTIIDSSNIYDMAQDGYTFMFSINQKIKINDNAGFEIGIAPALNKTNQEIFNDGLYNYGGKAYLSFQSKRILFFNNYSQHTYFRNNKFDGVNTISNIIPLDKEKNQFYYSTPFTNINTFYLGYTPVVVNNFKWTIYLGTYSITDIYRYSDRKMISYRIKPNIYSFGVSLQIKKITINPEFNLFPEVYNSYGIVTKQSESGILLSYEMEHKLKLFFSFMKRTEIYNYAPNRFFSYFGFALTL